MQWTLIYNYIILNRCNEQWKKNLCSSLNSVIFHQLRFHYFYHQCELRRNSWGWRALASRGRSKFSCDNCLYLKGNVFHANYSKCFCISDTMPKRNILAMLFYQTIYRLEKKICDAWLPSRSFWYKAQS